MEIQTVESVWDALEDTAEAATLWLNQVAVRGEVYVQFRLKPCESAVSLGVGDEQPMERIPEQLRRFL